MRHPDGLCADRRRDGTIRAIRAGKAPKRKGWQSGTTTRPPGNAGILVGAEFGLMCIETDSPEELAEYESWGLPETFTVESGHGRHHYWPYPAGRKVPGRYRGILVRGSGQVEQMVAPGSVHWTGRRYEIAADVALAELPEDFLDALEVAAGLESKAAKKARAKSGDGGYWTVNKALYQFVRKLDEQGVSEDRIRDLALEHHDFVNWADDNRQDLGKQVEKILERTGHGHIGQTCVDANCGKRWGPKPSADALKVLAALRKSPGGQLDGGQLRRLLGGRNVAAVRAEGIGLGLWELLPPPPACGGERQSQKPPASGRPRTTIRLASPFSTDVQIDDETPREPMSELMTKPPVRPTKPQVTAPFFCEGVFDFVFSSSLPVGKAAEGVVEGESEGEVRIRGENLAPPPPRSFGCRRCPGPVAYSKCPHRVEESA